MGYYDENGEWVDDTQNQDPLALLYQLAASQGGSAGKQYKGTDPFYYADQTSQNTKNLYGLLGINPIEQGYPLGEKGTVPYSPQADTYRQTSDPDLQAIYNDLDQGASLAQVQRGLEEQSADNGVDGGFTKEEIKSYFGAATAYDKAVKTDQIKGAQYNEQRRNQDPFGMEDNPELTALRDQYPTDESFGQQNFGDLLQTTKPFKSYQTTQNYRQPYTEKTVINPAAGYTGATDMQTGRRSPGNGQGKQRVITNQGTRNATRQVTVNHPSKSQQDTARFNKSFNDRVNAVAKFTSAQFGQQIRSMPRQTPTPGNQNYNARLAAVQALLGR